MVGMTDEEVFLGRADVDDLHVLRIGCHFSKASFAVT